MMLIACIHCRFALRVSGDPEELDAVVGKSSSLWPDDYECARCGEKAKGLFEPEADPRALAMLHVVDVNPFEAFSASMGMGLPTERSCTLKDVEELLKKPLKHVLGKNIVGTTRCVVDRLVFEDGTALYLGASAEGATVYRVTRPHSYVEATGG